MRLVILFLDDSVEDIPVRRVSNVSSSLLVPILYYECTEHLVGKGVSVPMCKIKCWEVKTTCA